MFLTESIQKSFYNYKETLENVEKIWDKMTNCETCRDDEKIIGACINDDCNKGNCKYCKIKFLKDMTSGFLTNLLKDIGTRGEKEPSPYYDIYLKRGNKKSRKIKITLQILFFNLKLNLHSFLLVFNERNYKIKWD